VLIDEEEEKDWRSVWLCRLAYDPDGGQPRVVRSLTCYALPKAVVVRPIQPNRGWDPDGSFRMASFCRSEYLLQEGSCSLNSILATFFSSDLWLSTQTPHFWAPIM
jgi:hypothetical protein